MSGPPRSPRHFALVPAAGTGSRVGADLPKQYLTLDARTILAHSVATLARADWIDSVTVVVSPGDTLASVLLRDEPKARVAPVGGASRRDSVLAGLRAMSADPDDWVLVHDAARPGLSVDDLERLRATLAHDPVGGLLALPVADTVKAQRADGGPPARVARTVPRAGLWLAQTPQMFRHGPLLAALLAHAEVTDEASAIEADGGVPVLVPGSLANFKVTTAADLALMRRLVGAAAASPESR